TNNGGNRNFNLGRTVETTLTLTTNDTSNSMFDSDIVLVMDRSGSMGPDYSRGLPKAKIEIAKDALNAVVDIVAASSNPGTRVALATFSSEATLDQELTTNYNAVKVAINSMRALGATTIGGGLIAGAGALNEPPGLRKRYIILASDGQHNTPPNIGEGIPLVPSDVTVYTVGIGNDADVAALTSIATNAGSKNGLYFTSSARDLVDTFEKITREIMGAFTLEDIRMDFARDDSSHLTLLSSSPFFSRYDLFTNTVIWNNTGDMTNGRSDSFVINFSTRRAGSNIPINTDRIRTAYTISGVSCIEFIPVNVLFLNIIDNPIPCSVTTWTPDPVNMCTTQTFNQVSNCGTVRNNVTGTKHCPQCSDFIDNDGDAKIDYPLDPGCSNSEDDFEFNILSLFEF
ncbi:MAG: vWA domain-containing protein, partial [Candidatus Paceibacterota bacterium]